MKKVSITNKTRPPPLTEQKNNAEIKLPMERKSKADKNNRRKKDSVALFVCSVKGKSEQVRMATMFASGLKSKNRLCSCLHI